MKKHNLKNSGKERSRALLEIRPQALQQGATVLVSGSGWPLDAITFKLGKEIQQPDRILNGSRWNQLLVPDPNGSFLIELSTQNLKPGSYSLRAETRVDGAYQETEFKVEPRVLWGPNVPREKIDKPYLRGAAFKNLRTGDKTGWPEGLMEVIKQGWIRIHDEVWRKNPGIFYVAPVHGACNWVPLGPAPFSHGKGSMHKNNSGRVRSIAIDPAVPSRMYIGTASGGVWKSTDAGVTWVPKTDDKFSLAIGALAIDPVSANVIYAGTGEMVPGSDYGHYYGRGLLRSTNHGDSWTEIGSADFDLAEIARIVINPLDTANLFVAASNGLWESTMSGDSWVRLSENPCTDVVLVQNPAEPGTRKLVAGFSNLGVYSAVNSGSGWSAFTSVTVAGAPANPKRVVFGVCRTQPRFIYAAFSESGGGNMLAHVSKSEDWGATWMPRTIPSTAIGRIYQAYYNLAILPHPTNPETVLLAVVDMFTSPDGGGSWTQVSLGDGTRVHPDCHAIAYHPTNPDNIFVINDGGIFFTPDSCVTWKARNLDISTLQLYDLSQHPQYEAIMIAGSQDNGGFHYSGAPIWRRSWVPPGVTHNAMEGDVVVAQIDPHDPYYHYYGTGPEGTTRRSEDAGKLFPHSWPNFPGTQWWIPFYPDPRTVGVLYTGGVRLMRSEDRGTSWNPITNDLAASIRAIAFHPTDPLVLYVGTVGGEVYRITGPAADPWNTTTVTTEDTTHTGLPSGIGVPSLAVDAAGNVWASISDLAHTEATGEFTNHHVFRLDAGETSWAVKSDGLAMANPINTLVIDPLDSTRVFCGGDRGVFAWNAALEQWNPMDEGLPNAPVIKLLIHDPSRKLRAATYGRGVWERSMDGLSCSDYFLYFRDNLVDSGTTPSPDGVPHTYVGGEFCWHWQSEDIIVDPSMQTPAIVATPTDLYDNVVHLGARRGTNRVYVTIHNKGPFAVTNVNVRVFFAGAAGGLPGFPAGMLANPFSWTPAGSSPWNPVGAAFNIPRIEPGTTRLAHWEFVIPMSANRHSCLMAFATSAEDSFSSGGLMDPDQLVVWNRKVTLKNLDLDAMPPSGGGGSGSAPAGSTEPRELRMHSNDRRGNWFRTAIACGNLPENTVIVVAVDKASRKKLREEKVKLSRNARKVRDKFVRFRNHPKELKGYDLKNLIVRDAKAGEKIHIGEVIIKKEMPVGVVVWIHSRKWNPEQRYGYDMVQMLGKSITGGFSVRIADPNE